MVSKFSGFDPTRRQMIRSMVAGSALLPAIMQQCLADTADELSPKAPHFPAKAKRVIFMNFSGGMSHVETFDPKPKLTAAAREHQKAKNGKEYLAPCGNSSGIEMRAEVSDLFPGSAKPWTMSVSSAQCMATTRIMRRRRWACIRARSRLRGRPSGRG
jgi:hypothetical protein